MKLNPVCYEVSANPIESIKFHLVVCPYCKVCLKVLGIRIYIFLWSLLCLLQTFEYSRKLNQ